MFFIDVFVISFQCNDHFLYQELYNKLFEWIVSVFRFILLLPSYVGFSRYFLFFSFVLNSSNFKNVILYVLIFAIPLIISIQLLLWSHDHPWTLVLVFLRKCGFHKCKQIDSEIIYVVQTWPIWTSFESQLKLKIN